MKPMQTKTVTTAIVLEKRMPRKDGHYPVKLRVTFDRKQKFYSVRYDPEKIGDDFTDFQKFWLRKVDKSISMTELEFKKVRKGNPPEPYKSMSIYLQSQEAYAQETKQKLKPFTFDEFEARFFDKPRDDQDVFAALEAKAKILRENGKIGTAMVYESTLKSLQGYTKKEKYPFTGVSVPFLKKFEAWMNGRTIGKKDPKHISRTTISIYLRCLRSIFNESAPEGTFYPFGEKLYAIPTWNHNKRALIQADVAKIANYSVVDGTPEHRSRDLWLFSYLSNGMNFKDMAKLRYENIRGDTFIFERAKTAKAGKENPEIKVVISRQIGRIIDRWGTGSGYVFGILKEGMTAKEQYQAIAQAIKTTNKYMRRICEALEIPTATTYAARHSFATVLKRSGASIEFISESLGHKNIKTTQNYLGNFEIEEKKKWAELLLPEKDSNR